MWCGHASGVIKVGNCQPVLLKSPGAAGLLYGNHLLCLVSSQYVHLCFQGARLYRSQEGTYYCK